MISFGDFAVAFFAGAIPVAWYLICRWFMKKDEEETKRLDELEVAELQ